MKGSFVQSLLSNPSSPFDQEPWRQVDTRLKRAIGVLSQDTPEV